MSYQKADKVLPIELLLLIQQYVEGECIYIPRKADSKRIWGTNTNIRNELLDRNMQIYSDYLVGLSVNCLAQKHCLSSKSIQRILLQEKRNNA